MFLTFEQKKMEDSFGGMFKLTRVEVEDERHAHVQGSMDASIVRQKEAR